MAADFNNGSKTSSSSTNVSFIAGFLFGISVYVVVRIMHLLADVLEQYSNSI